MEHFFRNPEIISITFKWVWIQAVALVIGWMLFHWQIEEFKKDVLLQNTAIIGKMLQENPHLEGEIIGYFTQTPSAEELKAGEKVAKQYGYDESLLIEAIPYVNDLYNRSQRVWTLFFIFTTIGLLILVYWEYDKVFNKMKRISNQAQKAVEGEFVYLTDSGEGEYGSLVHHFNNMTHRLKETIEALHREKLFLKDTLSDISHQLKTPLSSLLLLNDIMLNRKVDPKQVGDFLHKSKEQLERMEWLILSLLKTAKMEAGTIRFHKRKEMVRIPIEKSIASLQPAMEQKEQTLQIDERKKEITLSLDPEWLSEAFSNIIKNCVEHTGVGGMIEVILDENPVAVTVIIRDDGKGISPKDLPHIFKRFYRAHGEKGIGIGLSLAKAIIENHNGLIRVQSRLGEGTEFTITFFKHAD